MTNGGEVLSILTELKWEFLFAIVVVIAATAGLIVGSLDQNIWYQSLALIVTFLGGIGYGMTRTLRKFSK